MTDRPWLPEVSRGCASTPLALLSPSIFHPGGVFALWSDDPPDEDFNTALRTMFTTSEARVIRFDNPYGGEAANTVYVARRS